MTALFAKEVLEGSKFLLKFSQVKPIENVPQFKVHIFILSINLLRNSVQRESGVQLKINRMPKKFSSTFLIIKETFCPTRAIS